LILGHVIFESKRHYSYGDDGGDDENSVASLFSNLSKNCSDVSPYVVTAHVVVTNVFGSDFESVEDRSGSSFLQEVCHALLCVMCPSQIFKVLPQSALRRTNR
jgi:hypothetical protein